MGGLKLPLKKKRLFGRLRYVVTDRFFFLGGGGWGFWGNFCDRSMEGYEKLPFLDVIHNGGWLF